MSCVYMPEKGKDLFIKLKRNFGYEEAVKLYYTAFNPNFKEDFKSSLKYDEEGVVTYDSFIQNRYIKKLIGNDKIINSLQKDFKTVEDTEFNYSDCVLKANQFNTTAPNKEDFVAVVEKNKEGNLQVRIKVRTEETSKQAANQYASYSLNNKLSSMFSKIGVTVGKLTEIEQNAGRVGVTDFSVAKSIASDFGSIVRVANNMEGAQAVGEEFSHLIIGCFIKDPLIQRSINLLSEHPEILKEILGEEDYNDTVKFHDNDMRLVAEEALGHLLQEHFTAEMSNGNTTPVIAKRALSKIISQFKDYDVEEIQKAIADADNLMHSLAEGFLAGRITVTKQQIVDNQRYVKLNALTKEADRNIKILKSAIEIESKRRNIVKDKQEEIDDLIVELQSYLGDEAAAIYGISSYMKEASNALINIHKRLDVIETLDEGDKFAVLRRAKDYIDSYGRFIAALNDAIITDKENQDHESKLVYSFKHDNEVIDIQQSLNALKKLYDDLGTRYELHAKQKFANFLAPFFGVREIKVKNKKVTIEDLLEESEDISFFDKWLDSMTDSSDVILQSIGLAVNNAKQKARLATIENINEIQALMLDMEKAGITDYEWMFEKDKDGKKTGNLISEVNYGQYILDVEALKDRLNAKYGDSPKGNELKEKIKEIKEWHKTHSKNGAVCKMPNPIYYKNATYDRLSDSQKKYLLEYRKIKDSLEMKLPESNRNTLRAIQKRQDSISRFMNTKGDPKKMLNAVVDELKADFVKRVDDDQVYGLSDTSKEDGDKKTIVDYANKEYKKLPIFYVSRLENPDEISTDVFGSLISYAFMANQYEQMDLIIDPLEVGMDVLRKRKMIKSGLKEEFDFFGFKVKNPVYKEDSNSLSKLEDFMNAQVYGRYLEDHGEVELFGLKFDIQKTTSALLKASAAAQLGFNYAANIVNITNGLHNQATEAAARKYFKFQTLKDADFIYKDCMKDKIAELGQRVKTNKLDLFDDIFDIKQDFSKKTRMSNKRKSLLRRLFGENVAFFGQEGGDHWLYNRTAIAMALETEVYIQKDGNLVKTNLWDALQVENAIKGRDDIKTLNYKNIFNADHSTFNIMEFSNKVKHINQYLFGIYNEEDQASVQRYALGRILMLYRRWVKPLMNKRFMKEQDNLVTGDKEEGFHRTMGRFLNELRRGQFQIAAQWATLEDWEKQNIKRSMTELIQAFVFWGLANWWIDWGDKKKRPWLAAYCELIARKDAHDLASLAPSTVMVQENIKTFSDPSAVVSTVQSLFDLTKIVTSPLYAQEEIKSGPYKGMTRAEKWIYNTPIQGINEYRRFNKTIYDLDNSIQFFSNPTVR